MGCESKRKRNFPWRTTPSTRLQHQPITSLGNPFEPTCIHCIGARSYFKISKCRLLFEVGLESVLFYALVLRGTQYHTSSTFHRWYVLMFTYVILFYFGGVSAGIVVYWFLGVSGEQYGTLYVEESIISYKERDARISCVFILPSEFIEFVVTAEWN